MRISAQNGRPLRTKNGKTKYTISNWYMGIEVLEKELALLAKLKLPFPRNIELSSVTKSPRESSANRKAES